MPMNPMTYFNIDERVILKEQIKNLQAENVEINIKIEKIKHRFNLTKRANKQYKKEIEELKHRLENKEKAYNHLCSANNRKKEQIKNLNYMLFEEKEMTTKEWKLKYRLAYKERKFIQYKEITNKRLNKYKQVLEDIDFIINQSCILCNEEEIATCDLTTCRNGKMQMIKEIKNIIDEVLD